MHLRGRVPDRHLATILFIDIVGSTDHAARLGDRGWRRLVAAYHATVRRELRRFGGREVDTAGDGVFATFAQPAQAVRGADAIASAVAALGVEIRTGIHTGETETIGRKAGGIAVHIAARIMALAGPSEILVSSTVRDLVAGSGLEFEERGEHELKGVPGRWHVLALVRRTMEGAADGGGPADAASVVVAHLPDPAEEARRRRRSRLMLGTALVAVALLAGVGGLLVAGAPGRQPAAEPILGPEAVVELRVPSGQVERGVAVLGGPASVVVDAGGVWVAALDAGVVNQLSLDGLEARQTLGRVGRPADLAAGAGIIWIADPFGDTISMIDASTGDERGEPIEDVHARRIAFGFNALWATDDLRDRVLRIDPRSGTVAATIDLGAGSEPTAIAVSGDRVWVANVGSRSIVRVDPATNAVEGEPIPLRVRPEAIAAGDGAAWVAGRQTDEVIRIDPASGLAAGTVSVGDGPASIGVVGKVAWIGCGGDGTIWTVDGTTARQVARLEGVPGDIEVATSGDRIWVAIQPS